ncbi:MAG: hypothetical protein QOJ98_1007 [Acidobacteriota bacterium]|jgi:hypothetical protein|nr:hypothetical protein [Acidobacteriota bacterium]
MVKRLFLVLALALFAIPTMAADQSTADEWPTIARNQTRQLPDVIDIERGHRPGDVETLICSDGSCPCPGWEIIYDSACRTDLGSGLKYCENGWLNRICTWNQGPSQFQCKTCI